MASVTFDKVTKAFGETLAVRDFTLEIVDGEFLVLVGPSGCGKSTTLRMLAGLEPITSGTIRIGDRVVNNVPAKDRDIAMVFQSYALYPHMSVFDNMAFALSLRGVPKAERRRRVEEAADILGIGELLARKPGQLSGGQRQRVALGRAIVRQPAVFLLDEPLSNLDAKLRVQTRAELTHLHERLGTTFVYVTHDQLEAMTMATRIVVMDRGWLQQVGSPREIYERPVNQFVAGFIGSPAMNFMDADVTREGDQICLVAGGFKAPASDRLRENLRSYIDKRVVLGIRPEHLYDADLAPTDIPTHPMSGLVDLAEELGNEVFLHVDANTGTRILARVNPRTSARSGATISLAADETHMYAFDPETGESLASH